MAPSGTADARTPGHEDERRLMLVEFARADVETLLGELFVTDFLGYVTGGIRDARRREGRRPYMAVRPAGLNCSVVANAKENDMVVRSLSALAVLAGGEETDSARLETRPKALEKRREMRLRERRRKVVIVVGEGCPTGIDVVVGFEGTAVGPFTGLRRLTP